MNIFYRDVLWLVFAGYDELQASYFYCCICKFIYMRGHILYLLPSVSVTEFHVCPGVTYIFDGQF